MQVKFRMIAVKQIVKNERAAFCNSLIVNCLIFDDSTNHNILYFPITNFCVSFPAVMK